MKITLRPSQLLKMNFELRNSLYKLIKTGMQGGMQKWIDVNGAEFDLTIVFDGDLHVYIISIRKI